MKYNIIQVHYGEFLDDVSDLSLFQLCTICNLAPELIIEMVNEGILNPDGKSKLAWRFSFLSVDRVRRVQRLRTDLNLNVAGAALALDLLDKIEQLESMIERR
jgi:chaperone modulatory protein CbpM